MPYYITINREPVPYQLTFEDILSGLYEARFALQKNTRDTVTRIVDRIPDRLISNTNFTAMEYALQNFVAKYTHLVNEPNKSKFYYSFKIPKRSGGRRQIDAPSDELKAALYELKDILEKKFYASYHTSAFAYISGRSTIDSLKRHQTNKSRWFLKLDMKNFFTNITPEFLVDMLCKTFPFCEFAKLKPSNLTLLQDALSLCFLNGGLPQGTPTSPMLTNALMIPIDHALSKMCRKHAPHLCYTRYADDMLISSEYSFMWSEVQSEVDAILKEFGAPFQINWKKTRYGSSNGANWNLGVMLNAENKITVGYAKKNIFKVMIHQFMMDYASGTIWSLEDVQHLGGLLSYYRMVERDAIDAILSAASKKYNKNVEETIKDLIKSLSIA